jgi:hypothetical protein
MLARTEATMARQEERASNREANVPLSGENTDPAPSRPPQDNRHPIRKEGRPDEDRQRLPVDGESAYGQESR